MLSVSIQTPSVIPGEDKDGVWSCLYILPGWWWWGGCFSWVWLCAGLRLDLSVFEGHVGRASLDQGCAGTLGSRGRKSSGCRGNFSHGLCAERNGLSSPSQVSPESGLEEEKEICMSRSSHQHDPRGRLLQPHSRAVTGCLPSLTCQRTF